MLFRYSWPDFLFVLKRVLPISSTTLPRLDSIVSDRSLVKSFSLPSRVFLSSCARLLLRNPYRFSPADRPEFVDQSVADCLGEEVDTPVAHQEINSARAVALQSTAVVCAAGRVIFSFGRAPQVRMCRVEWNLSTGIPCGWQTFASRQQAPHRQILSPSRLFCCWPWPLRPIERGEVVVGAFCARLCGEPRARRVRNSSSILEAAYAGPLWDSDFTAEVNAVASLVAQR